VQSSTVLAALDQSNQQSDQFSSLVTLMHDNDPRLNKAKALITELVFGEVNPKSSAQALIQLLGNKP
jgi:hypothetical protein